MMAPQALDAHAAPTNKTALDLTRQQLRDMFMASQAFQALPPEQQREIARNTVEVASYLAAPEGIPGNQLPTALADATAPGADDVRKIGGSQFRAGAAREGAAVAGALLREVNFPTFVAGLIKGVFHAIVESSIEQMEAYGRLVADVAKTLNEFRDENVSANQGRDHLMDSFPDLFQLDASDPSGAGPRVRLRDGVDEDAALQRVRDLPYDGGAPSSLDDDTIEEKLVPAARTQLATSRQQLLATMVLMGINRIVVTDGKISAKVLYDFQARDTRRFQRSAVAYDYAKEKDAYGGEHLARMSTLEGDEETSNEGGERSYDEGKLSDVRDGSYYSKGKYKYTEAPVLNAMSAASEQTDAALQTKASLAGVVEVNFKSDYFPLEKMADSFQIGMIQNAAQPGRGRPAAPGAHPGPGGQAALGGAAAGGGGQATPTGGAPAATPPPRQ